MAAKGEMQAGLFSHTMDARLPGQGPGPQPHQAMGTLGVRGSYLVSPGRNSGILGGFGAFVSPGKPSPFPLSAYGLSIISSQLLAGPPSWHMHPFRQLGPPHASSIGAWPCFPASPGIPNTCTLRALLSGVLLKSGE